MVVHFSKLPQHKSIVLKIYKTILENALFLRVPGFEKFQLIDKIRSTFRNNKSTPNSIVVRTQLQKALEFNNLLVECYKVSNEDQKFEELLREINPHNSKVKNTDSKDYELSLLIESNKEENKRRLLKESKFDKKKKNLSIRQNIQLNSYIQTYLNRSFLTPYKSRLDENYLNDIIASKVLHKKRKRYLDTLSDKLHNGSSSRIKRVTGTSKWIYIINTPWNTDLRTESFSLIGEVRKKHGVNLLDHNETEEYRSKWLWISEQEEAWENGLKHCGLIKTSIRKKKDSKVESKSKNEDSDVNGESTENWTWVFKAGRKLVDLEKREIDKQVVEFNKKQGLINKKIQPKFDDMHSKSKKNVIRLIKEMKIRQIGPYTDIVEDDLGDLLTKHGFKDPIEIPNINARKRNKQKN